MQDVNLQQLLANATSSAQSKSASSTVGSSPAAPVNLVAVTANLNQQTLSLRSASGKVVLSVDLTKQPISSSGAGSGVLNSAQGALTTTQLLPLLPELKYATNLSSSQQVQVFGDARTLLQTNLSNQQLQGLFEMLSRQPDLKQLAPQTPLLNTPIGAIVASISGQQVTVNLQPPIGGINSLPLVLSDNNRGLDIGQTVKVQLLQRGGQWIAQLIPTEPQHGSTAEKLGNSAKASIAENRASIRAALVNSSPIVQHAVQQSLSSGISLSSTNSVFASLMSQLQLKPFTQALQLSQSLLTQTNSNTGLQLTLKLNGEKLTVSAQMPLLKIDPQRAQVSNESWQQIRQLVSANSQINAGSTSTLNESKTPPPLLRQFLQLPVATSTQSSAQAPSSTDRVSLSNAVETKSGNAQREAFSSDRATPQKLAEHTQHALQSAIKQTFVKSEGASNNLQQLLQALAQLTSNQQADVKPIVEKSLTQLSAITTQQPDAQQIRQLIQLPAIPVQAQNIVQPQTSNSLVSGLVTLLQLSLASRLPNKSASAQSPVMQIISVLTAINQGPISDVQSKIAGKTKVQRKVSQDNPAVDPNGSVTKALSRFMSSHYLSKLSQAEAASQGQDMLYYAFPSTSASTQRDTELTITREKPSDSDNKRKRSDTTAWRLTLLLSVGELGQALCKCRLEEHALELDIYTSNERLKDTVLEHLPSLKKRFGSLGLELNSSQCQLGKIPETLQTRPYQLLQTTV